MGKVQNGGMSYDNRLRIALLISTVLGVFAAGAIIFGPGPEIPVVYAVIFMVFITYCMAGTLYGAYVHRNTFRRLRTSILGLMVYLLVTLFVGEFTGIIFLYPRAVFRFITRKPME